jgi:hypothetical protein
MILLCLVEDQVNTLPNGSTEGLTTDFQGVLSTTLRAPTT